MDPKLLQDLLGAGPIGLATVAFLVAGWAVRKLMEESRGRLDDQKEMGKQLTSIGVALSEQTRANEVRNDAFEESIRLQALTGVAVTGNASSLESLNAKTAAVATELARTREALIRNGAIGS